MPEESVPLGPLAEALSARLRAGESPSVEEYASRHPHLPDRIRELFPTLLLLQGRTGTGGPMAPAAGYAAAAAAPAAPSASAPTATAPPPPPGPTPTLAPGGTFGSYQIEREI